MSTTIFTQPPDSSLAAPLILFHRHCLDGSASAWLLHLRFGTIADYHAIDHNNEQTTIAHIIASSSFQRDLYIVDFTPLHHHLQQLLHHFKSVTIADHHPAALEETRQIDDARLTLFFSLHESGTTLTWQHLVTPHLSLPQPWFLETIKQIDLNLHHSQHADDNAIISLLNHINKTDFSLTIEQFNHLHTIGRKAAITEGKLTQKADDIHLQFLLSRHVHFLHTAIASSMPAIDIPLIHTRTSINLTPLKMWDLIGKAHPNAPLLMAFYIGKDDNLAHVSLRPNFAENSPHKNTPLNVDHIAKFLSQNPRDGGREHAAVMHITREKLNSLSPRPINMRYIIDPQSTSLIYYHQGKSCAPNLATTLLHSTQINNEQFSTTVTLTHTISQQQHAIMQEVEQLFTDTPTAHILLLRVTQLCHAYQLFAEHCSTHHPQYTAIFSATTQAHLLIAEHIEAHLSQPYATIKSEILSLWKQQIEKFTNTH